jgi:hypothetical protein
MLWEVGTGAEEPHECICRVRHGSSTEVAGGTGPGGGEQTCRKTSRSPVGDGGVGDGFDISLGLGLDLVDVGGGTAYRGSGAGCTQLTGHGDAIGRGRQGAHHVGLAVIPEDGDSVVDEAEEDLERPGGEYNYLSQGWANQTLKDQGRLHTPATVPYT